MMKELSVYVVLICQLWLVQCLPVKRSLKHDHGKILKYTNVQCSMSEREPDRHTGKIAW